MNARKIGSASTRAKYSIPFHLTGVTVEGCPDPVLLLCTTKESRLIVTVSGNQLRVGLPKEPHNNVVVGALHTYMYKGPFSISTAIIECDS